VTSRAAWSGNNALSSLWVYFAVLLSTFCLLRSRYNIVHILLDCLDLQDIQQKYFTASSLKDILESIDSQEVVGFYQRCSFLPSIVLFLIHVLLKLLSLDYNLTFLSLILFLFITFT